MMNIMPLEKQTGERNKVINEVSTGTEIVQGSLGNADFSYNCNCDPYWAHLQESLQHNYYLGTETKVFTPQILL